MLSKSSGTEVPTSCQRPTWLALTRALAQGEKLTAARALLFTEVTGVDKALFVSACAAFCHISTSLKSEGFLSFAHRPPGMVPYL